MSEGSENRSGGTGRDGEDQPPGDGETATITVIDGDREATLSVPVGSNLRAALLSAGFSPYTSITRRANCGGRGICATCGVRVAEDVSPAHWHDDLADRFGYPRLSCQITVEEDLTVTIPEKLVWGRRTD